MYRSIIASISVSIIVQYGKVAMKTMYIFSH